MEAHTAPGGYFGRALVVDLADASGETLPLPDDVLRAYIGGAGLGAWLMHELAPPGVDPLGARGAARVLLLAARGHAADHEREVRRRREVAAHRPAQRCARLEPLRDRRQADGPRRDRRARRLRGAVGRCSSTATARASSRPATSGACPPTRPSSGCASGSARPGESPRSARRASASSSTRRSRTTAATPGRGGLGAVLGAKLLKASPCGRRRRSRPPTRRRSSPRPATCGSARSARRRRSTASSARSRTCWPSTRSRRSRPATSRRRRSPTPRAWPPRTSPRRAASPATAAPRARSAASTSTRAPAGSRSASSTRTCSRSARCAASPTRTPSSRPAAAATSSASTRSPPAARSRGRWSAPSAASSTRRGCASATRTRCCARSTRSALARASARCSPRARAPPRAVVGQGSAAFAPQVKGLELPGLRAAHAAGDGARASRSTRAAPTTTARAPTRPTSPAATTASAAASPHVAAAIGTEDRAAVMDSLILCKFLRGVFDDPFPEWARLLSSVTGWDVDGAELEATARRIVLAKRAFNVREGWTRADDGLPGPLPQRAARGRLRTQRDAHPRAARRDDRGVLREPAGWTHLAFSKRVRSRIFAWG